MCEGYAMRSEILALKELRCCCCLLRICTQEHSLKIYTGNMGPAYLPFTRILLL